MLETKQRTLKAVQSVKSESAVAGFDTTWYWGVFKSPRAFAQLAATWELVACAFGWDQKTGGWVSQFMSQLDDRRGYVEITYHELGEIKYPDQYSEKPIAAERKAERGIERTIEDFKLSGVEPIIRKKCGTITNEWGKPQQAPNKYCLNENFTLVEKLREYVLREDLLTKKEGKALTHAMISFLREEGKKIGCVQITGAMRKEYRESRADRRKKGKKKEKISHFGAGQGDVKVSEEKMRELGRMAPMEQAMASVDRGTEAYGIVRDIEDPEGDISAAWRESAIKAIDSIYADWRKTQAAKTPRPAGKTQSERAQAIVAQARSEDAKLHKPAGNGISKAPNRPGGIGNYFKPGESDRFDDGTEKPF